MRVVAYVRVSTLKQAKTGLSLAAQEKRLRAYCALYDLELVAVEIDRAKSAKPVLGRRKTGDWRAAVDAKRPALGRALARLDSGDCAGLVVFKLGRLTRSHRDLDELITRYFGGACALFSVSEQVDTRSASGRLVLNVLMSVLQWERETTAERTATITAYKQERGEFIGGRVPYGFTVAANGALKHDEAEQAVIRAAMELRTAGESLRGTARALHALGHAPRNGGHWQPQQVKRMVAA